jgi:hypothetical protein
MLTLYPTNAGFRLALHLHCQFADKMSDVGPLLPSFGKIRADRAGGPPDLIG